MRNKAAASCKQREEKIWSNIVTTFISYPCPLFMLAPVPDCQISVFSPSSRLSTTMHHCALLHKCNLCDKTLPTIRNLNNQRIKHHTMNRLSSVSCPRFPDLCLFPPSPVEQSTLHNDMQYLFNVICATTHSPMLPT